MNDTIPSWHPRPGSSLPVYEPWLERWRGRLGPPPLRALDLGCGAGDDTSTLAAWGHSVTSIDASASAVAGSAARTPGAVHHVLDLRALPGPLEPGFGIVVASLSLHYFDEADSQRVFAAIHGLLAPGGVFAFRVNAEDDLLHGASGSHAGWKLVFHRSVHKQFFNEAKIRSLLEGWTIEHLEKRTTHRFVEAKSLYEAVAARTPR